MLFEKSLPPCDEYSHFSQSVAASRETCCIGKSQLEQGMEDFRGFMVRSKTFLRSGTKNMAYGWRLRRLENFVRQGFQKDDAFLQCNAWCHFL
mmetsp:Transcript_21984/g.46234  ORF Transcript_21984/g.46234 Transcript_21984/m.46234 type:complete len:93 (-) Transcript_21984:170-448(-)